ncbi:MAG: TolB-like 6-bladed beta-propeller domain-containing protein [Mediterranea sp.]|nr:TolB-like 6-bladed beta-propeller domain-containing protein [Mediterranea sp.]
MNRISALVLSSSSFLVVLLAMSGCHLSTRKPANPDVPEAKPLMADSVSIPSAHALLAVNRLFLTNGMLVAYEGLKDTLFSFWELPTVKHLYNAGLKGNGPNDFRQLERNFPQAPDGFYTFDMMTNTIKKMSCDANGDFRVSSTKRLDTPQMPLNRFLFLADSTYCFLSNDEKYEYTMMDKHGSRNFSEYPTTLSETKDEDIQFLYNKLLVARPDGKRFAAFYAYTKLLRIYNADGKLLHELVMQPKPRLSAEGDRVAYYSKYPWATNDFIYALTSDDGKQYLEVFSWDADFVARYQLNCPIDVFCVSEKQGVVYALDNDKECLLIYSLF